jgi:hypothetical protein
VLKASGCVLCWSRGGVSLAEWSRTDDTGLAPKESVIETLCGLPVGWPAGGFLFLHRFFW